MMHKRLSTILVTVVTFLNSTANSYAAPGVDLEFKNPLQTQTISDLLDGILIYVRWIGIPIAVGMIVYSGILFLGAGANPNLVTKARTILIYAIIGLVVILIGKGFLTLIQSILALSKG